MKVFLRLAVALATAIGPAMAQEFPKQPVRIIVPSAAGGGYDFTGRVLADHLPRHLGGSFVVENVTGAGNLVGTRSAAKLPPDGHGLLIGGLSNMVLNKGVHANLGYDPIKDFLPIGIVSSVPYVIVVRKDLPQNTLDAIIAASRAKPGSLNVATAGPGSGQDVFASIFASSAGITITKVPYRGSSPVYPDLMSGRVDLFIDVLSSVLPQAESGNVRMVATLGRQRSARAPDVPTVGEAGLPALTAELGSWTGLFAPAGVPEPIAQKLREGVAKAVTDPAFRQKVEASGAEVVEISGDQVRGLIERELGQWLPLMKQGGIEPQ